MDDNEQATARDLAAAAEVHAAKRQIDGAIADLASSPLDEAAADRMREVLASSKLRSARRALIRLQKPRRTHLSVVSELDADEPEEPVRVLAGGAA
ncbi:hypothetical protein [Nocardioides limicola]|uniref:hypothetical protein n=1 Tax=Nocardioides limicola TaxID=2803368 RepID=UPI00193B79A7|nr:hypothetical protein [Nocardioides sp. DJM-14]